MSIISDQGGWNLLFFLEEILEYKYGMVSSQ